MTRAYRSGPGSTATMSAPGSARTSSTRPSDARTTTSSGAGGDAVGKRISMRGVPAPASISGGVSSEGGAGARISRGRRKAGAAPMRTSSTSGSGVDGAW